MNFPRYFADGVASSCANRLSYRPVSYTIADTKIGEFTPLSTTSRRPGVSVSPSNSCGSEKLRCDRPAVKWRRDRPELIEPLAPWTALRGGIGLIGGFT